MDGVQDVIDTLRNLPVVGFIAAGFSLAMTWLGYVANILGVRDYIRNRRLAQLAPEIMRVQDRSLRSGVIETLITLDLLDRHSRGDTDWGDDGADPPDADVDFDPPDFP